MYKHCWLLLPSFPNWNKGNIGTLGGQKGKKMEVLERSARGVVEVIHLINEFHLAATMGHTPNTRPQGVKTMKVDHKETNFKGMTPRAFAKAMSDSTLATIYKVEIMAQQTSIQLFTVENSIITCPLSCKWFTLMQVQELAKYKKKLAADAGSKATIPTTSLSPCMGATT